MMVQLASHLVTLWLSSLVSGQSSLSGLPGLEQWQSHMRQHAAAVGRSEPQLALDSQRGLWQSQIDQVREEEERLGRGFLNENVNIEEDNENKKTIDDILKQIR